MFYTLRTNNDLCINVTQKYHFLFYVMLFPYHIIYYYIVYHWIIIVTIPQTAESSSWKKQPKRLRDFVFLHLSQFTCVLSSIKMLFLYYYITSCLFSEWMYFESWRDFTLQATEQTKHDTDMAECRYENRWMEKEIARLAKRYKNDEMARIHTKLI